MAKVSAALFNFMSNSPGTIIPSTRIARYVQEELDVPAYWNDPAIAGVRADTLILVNGAFAFCKALEELAVAIKAARRIVWIQNDYTINPPINNGNAESPFRRAFVERRERKQPHLEFWTTCEKFAKVTPLSSYVNWNALTWEPWSPQKIAAARRKASNDLFYYGSFRNASGNASRLRYFDRYFKDCPLPLTISSPAVGMGANPKFVERYPGAEHTGKFKTGLLDEIARHGIGLYIEDIMSHKEFHSPANRLYEMASAGIPIMFQPEAQGMLRRAGIEISNDWTAQTHSKMKVLWNSREEIGRDQQKLMRGIDHLGALEKQFKDGWEKLRKGM